MESGRASLYSGSGYASQAETQARAQTSSLDLFEQAPLEKQMRGSTESVIMPNCLDDTGPYTFQIKKMPHHYVDLGSCRLTGKVSVRQIDLSTGQDSAVLTDNISICNYFPAALFRAVNVNVMGQSVSKMSAPFLHLKMYLQTLLGYNEGAKDTHLRAAGWSMDRAKEFETKDHGEAANRKTKLEYSKVFDFSLPLTTDLFALDKLLPDFLDLEITFERNLDSIPLYVNQLDVKEPLPEDATDDQKAKRAREIAANAATFKIKFHSLALRVRRVLLTANLVAEHQRLLHQDKPMRYPLTRTEVKVAGTISTGESSIVLNDLFNNRLPNNLVIGLMHTSNLNGSFKRNPFYFPNLKLTNIYLEVNQKKVPPDGYTPNFEKGLVSREYRALFDNCGIQNSNHTNAISPELFYDGCTLYAFDLTPDMCLNYHSHMQEFGLITATVMLGEPVKEPVSVVVFASFDDVFFIDKDGQCFYEMAAGIS